MIVDSNRRHAGSQSKFDQDKEASPFRAVIVFFQLFGIFLLVRLVMIHTGITLIRIPLIDSGIRGAITWLTRQAYIWGLM